MKVKKVINIVLRVILTLILISPILGVLGIFPEPTRDLYNTDSAFNFIQVMMNDASYISYILALVFAISAISLWIGREALAAILIFPITVNIIAFHLFLDGGLFTSGAIMGNILLLLNIYFLWVNREQYNTLLKRK